MDDEELMIDDKTMTEESLESQIERLASWLIENTEEPKDNYSAADAAINALTDLRAEIEVLESRIMLALEIAKHMCNANRNSGMTIEGRGEVIQSILTGVQ